MPNKTLQKEYLRYINVSVQDVYNMMNIFLTAGKQGIKLNKREISWMMDTDGYVSRKSMSVHDEAWYSECMIEIKLSFR
jgi:hypothetical protein